MDPNAALAALRSLVTSYRNGGKWDEVDTDDLVERIGDLDEWLVKGGFLPDAWDTERPRHGFVPQSTVQEFCAAPDDQDGTDLCGLHLRAHSW